MPGLRGHVFVQRLDGSHQERCHFGKIHCNVRCELPLVYGLSSLYERNLLTQSLQSCLSLLEKATWSGDHHLTIKRMSQATIHLQRIGCQYLPFLYEALCSEEWNSIQPQNKAYRQSWYFLALSCYHDISFPCLCRLTARWL